MPFFNFDEAYRYWVDYADGREMWFSIARYWSEPRKYWVHARLA